MKLTLSRALAQRADSELVDLHDLWVGGNPPRDRKGLLAALRGRMKDAGTLSAVCARLDENAGRVLDLLRGGPDGVRRLEDLTKAAGDAGIGVRTVRSALDALGRYGLAFPVSSGRGSSRNGRAAWAVPADLVPVFQESHPPEREPRELFTLHGHLEAHFRRQGAAEEEAGERARKMYRFLASEKALLARLDGLPEGVRSALHAAITRWGGVVPAGELGELPGGTWTPAELGRVLGEASLGEVGDLDLERFGIRQRGTVVVVFNEAVLAYLRREAAERPVEPATVSSLGVDFVSNFSRFTSFVGDQSVRFTVRGTIFKSTGKRITEHLIANPGREFKRREILDLLYRFSLAYRLIDRTGERAFMLTPAGQDFLRLPLADKQRRMLDWLSEDRELPGDMVHQLRLRRITLRFLKRLETGLWYDAMFLPFVVRNHYLASLGLDPEPDRDGASFPVRSSADLQSLAWNLFTWVRKHLYLLGLVDMGYDESGRACAIRLTNLGAELLGMISGRELGGAGKIVVNPDFEVVLFPEENSHELVYTLDRFCQRELTDSLYHYRITPESLHRALGEGMGLGEVLALLEERSRTPLPQNVVFSLESWARSDGMVTLHEDGRLTCDAPEILDRLATHPEIGALVHERVDLGTLRLQTPVPAEELEEWVRDAGVAFRRAG